MAGGGGGCVYNGLCCNGSVTGKEEGISFTHKVGASHDPVPLFSFCLKSVNITPQVKISGVWTNMNSTTIIKASPTKSIQNAQRPCVKNATFTLTPNTGSGGSTWNCRYKGTEKTDGTYYCYFNVTVNAPASTYKPQIITVTT